LHSRPSHRSVPLCPRQARCNATWRLRRSISTGAPGRPCAELTSMFAGLGGPDSTPASNLRGHTMISGGATSHHNDGLPRGPTLGKL
jgi:hypothetical protein